MIYQSKLFIETNFQLEKSYCFRLSEKIEILKDNCNLTDRVKYLSHLSKELNIFSKYNFVHGDLNQKNIKLTTSGYVVLDFEPLLSLSVKGRYLHMCTYPCICNEDLTNDVITSRTDKLSFDIFCKKKLKFKFTEKLSLKYVNELFFKTNKDYAISFEQIALNNINQVYTVSKK